MFYLNVFLIVFLNMSCMEDISSYSILKNSILCSITIALFYYINECMKKEEREKWIREYLEKHAKD